MGKRELLLIIGFVVFGALVYQVSAPARQPGQTGFSFSRILDTVRREMRGNRARAEVTTKDVRTVPDGIRELRVALRSVPVTIIGEARDDIAFEWFVRSNGFDDAEAKRLAEASKLLFEPAGPALLVKATFPPEGSQSGRLELRVPAGMLVEMEPSVGRVEISGVAAVELENARGETIVKNVKGRAAITHRGGDLVVEDVGTLRLNTRGSEARVAGVHGESVLQLVAGQLRATELAGPVEVEATAVDITIEGLQRTSRNLRLNVTEGTLVLRGLSSEARIDGRSAEIDVTMDAPAPLAIFNTSDDVSLTPPEKGYTLDAVASGGTITLPAGFDPAVTVAKDEAAKEERAKGNVNGGGPTITVRSTRADIRIRGRE